MNKNDNRCKNAIKSRINREGSLPIELLRRNESVIDDYVKEINNDVSKIDTLLIQKIIMAILIKEKYG